MTLCSGAFDGLHAGHVRYLQAARRLAPHERLVVAIAPDAYIEREKQRHPYWPQADRAHTVFALDCVNDVRLQTGLSVAQEILDTKPHRFVKGRDWLDKLPDDVLAACQQVGCEVVFVNTPGRHVREARR